MTGIPFFGVQTLFSNFSDDVGVRPEIVTCACPLNEDASFSLLGMVTTIWLGIHSTETKR